MKKSFAEINEKIGKGTAVVFTAEEVIGIAEEQGIKKAAEKVDVVTTGTFGPMCSSGVFINFGQSDPPIKMIKTLLNGVPAYSGLASVDAYLGVTELKENSDELYGGAHVIAELLAGKKVHLKATGAQTACKPAKEIEAYIDLESLNDCILFNPRNSYQNYLAAVNSTDKTLYTYLGKIAPDYGNICYCNAGQLSPLLNDPYLRTIGIGTRIFLGGARGFVSWHGTQHNPEKPRFANGIPAGPACTLSVVGNLKEMDPRYLRPNTIPQYGVSMYIGIGIPIPVLDEEMMHYVSVKDRDIRTVILDYGIPVRNRPVVGEINYEELKSGSAEFRGKRIPTLNRSSVPVARKIAAVLKEWIQAGDFLLQEPVAMLPQKNQFKPLDAVNI